MGERDSLQSFRLLDLEFLYCHISPFDVEEVSGDCKANVEKNEADKEGNLKNAK